MEPGRGKNILYCMPIQPASIEPAGRLTTDINLTLNCQHPGTQQLCQAMDTTEPTPQPVPHRGGLREQTSQLSGSPLTDPSTVSAQKCSRKLQSV